jgi:putative ABC transport system permease protein
VGFCVVFDAQGKPIPFFVSSYSEYDENGLKDLLSVQQRSQEIGIRMALGAEAGHVLRMVVSQGTLLALAGVVIGVASALGLSRLLATFLFGLEPRDLTVFIAVPLTLALVSLIAVRLPARRAAKVDPAIALRTE